MDREISILYPRLRAERGFQTWRTPPESHQAATGRASSPSCDEIYLSRLYQALHSPEMAARLQNLQLQVSDKTYLVLALQVSHSIVEDCLHAA